VDIDDIREAPQSKLTFVVDQEKAAINGVTTEQIAGTLRTLLQGTTAGTVRSDTERNPLRIELRLPTAQRAGAADLARIHVSGDRGELVPLAELGRWETSRVDQTIYHKNLQPVA
jgi:multidrug efflux pump subunit AcrB